MLSERQDPGRIGHPQWSRGLTFPQLLTFAAIMLPILAALRFSISTIDLAYLIRAGEAMLDTGHLLRTDTFTFSVAGHEWLNQQWGAEILFALLYRHGEWEAIALSRAVLVGIIFCLELLACRAAGASRRAAAWLTLGAFVVCLDGLTLRPQLLGIALFSLTLWLVASRSRRPRLLWVLPFVVAVWANVHGSFVLAPMLLGFAWLEDRLNRGRSARNTLYVGFACFGAALMNPFGMRIWAYVADLSTDPEIRRFIQEWQPTRPTSAIGASFYLSVAAVTIIVILRRSRLPWPRILALATFVALGMQAVRGVLWWALAAPVLIAELFPERSPRRDSSSLLSTATALTLVLLAIPMLPWFRQTFAGDANSFNATDGVLMNVPAELSEAVGANLEPGSRLFVAQIWASWFELALPDLPVFVDPRIELFPAAIWTDYDVVSTAGEGWQAILDRWGVDGLVLSRRQQPELIAAIADEPEWLKVWEDADGVALVRASSAASDP